MLKINGKQIYFDSFSGGEIDVKLNTEDLSSVVRVEWIGNRPESPMELLLTLNALKHHGVSVLIIEILYMPYARQDRVCNQGEALSLEVMFQILSNANYHPAMKIHYLIYDIHSRKVEPPLNWGIHWTHISPAQLFSSYNVLNKITTDLSKLIICSPDSGAEARATEVASKYGLPLLECTKYRNSFTGEINQVAIINNPDLTRTEALIIDDICDGGQTFIEVAKMLKKAGMKKLYLYVTHGIFSRGTSELSEYYDLIICYHLVHPMLTGKNVIVLRGVYS